MENALIRGRQRHPAEFGSDVLVGPHAHVNVASIGDSCFIAAGASLFPGARPWPRAEVRIDSGCGTVTTLSGSGYIDGCGRVCPTCAGPVSEWLRDIELPF